MYKFDFVVRNLSTGKDSDWLRLMQTSTEELTELWYNTVQKGYDYEIVDFESNLDIPYDSVIYMSLNTLLSLKQFLNSHESLYEAFQIQAALEDDYTLLDIVNNDIGYNIFEQPMLFTDDESFLSLGYYAYKEYGMQDSDMVSYFDVTALGKDLSFDSVDEETDERYEDMSYEEIGQEYIDDVGLSGRLLEQYFDFARYGEEISWDYNLVLFEPADSGEEKFAWVMRG